MLRSRTWKETYLVGIKNVSGKDAHWIRLDITSQGSKTTMYAFRRLGGTRKKLEKKARMYARETVG